MLSYDNVVSLLIDFRMLCVYPKGNEEEGGDGHLSVYVTLIDKPDSDTSINASLRFFIYDQIRDNYLAFLGLLQDHCLAIFSFNEHIIN